MKSAVLRKKEDNNVHKSKNIITPLLLPEDINIMSQPSQNWGVDNRTDEQKVYFFQTEYIYKDIKIFKNG